MVDRDAETRGKERTGSIRLLKKNWGKRRLRQRNEWNSWVHGAVKQWAGEGRDEQKAAMRHKIPEQSAQKEGRRLSEVGSSLKTDHAR